MRLKDKFILALQRQGENIVENARVVNYTVMTRREGDYYFVGRAGALRAGRTVRSSVPVSSRRKEQLLVSLTESPV